MREIKFRAWETKKKCFDYEPLICRGKCCFIDSFDNFEEYEENRMVLQQYTGLKDKNGKEVYEGDLLQDRKGVGEVKWVQEHCAFLIRTLNPHMYYYLESDERLTESEVIGNIYTNPELLEVTP